MEMDADATITRPIPKSASTAIISCVIVAKAQAANVLDLLVGPRLPSEHRTHDASTRRTSAAKASPRSS